MFKQLQSSGEWTRSWQACARQQLGYRISHSWGKGDYERICGSTEISQALGNTAKCSVQKKTNKHHKHSTNRMSRPQFRETDICHRPVEPQRWLGKYWAKRSRPDLTLFWRALWKSRMLPPKIWRCIALKMLNKDANLRSHLPMSKSKIQIFRNKIFPPTIPPAYMHYQREQSLTTRDALKQCVLALVCNPSSCKTFFRLYVGPA